MTINRDFYLNQLIESRHNRLIKIVTGIRRSGKSTLLFELFHNYLIQSGVDEKHIVEIAFDDRRKAALRNPDNALKYIEDKMTDGGMYYILLDEVQLMDDFADVLNSLLHIKNADVYVTGSNSRFLSKDVATEFRGRGDEIHLYPFSFAEFCSVKSGSKQELWKEYYTFGGLPQLFVFNDKKRKEKFLLSLQESVYLKDLIERNKVKNTEEFKELMKVMASGIGSPCNPTKLSNTFKSEKGVVIDKKTVSNYLNYMEDAFVLEKAMRYDIKGKKYINTLNKYYFQDIGLRNALLDFRQLEESHIMENIIYNELRSRGYRVDVGSVEVRKNDSRKQLEVDFVVNRGDFRCYIQSAMAIPDKEKKEQETASLKNINDLFKRIIIVKDDIVPHYDENGYFIIGLFDFLLKPNSLETI